jgi:hypothetical protein
VLCDDCAARPPLVDVDNVPDPPDPHLLADVAPSSWLDGEPMDPEAVAV